MKAVSWVILKADEMVALKVASTVEMLDERVHLKVVLKPSSLQPLGGLKTTAELQLQQNIETNAAGKMVVHIQMRKNC